MMSFTETLISVFIGYTVAVITQIVVFPWFDIHLSFSSNMVMASIFTFISIIRGYVIRRIFNKISLDKLKKV